MNKGYLKKTTFERIMRQVERMERQGNQAKPSGGNQANNREKVYLVKLTESLNDNPRTWKATQVYIDATGAAQDITGGIVFDADNPVLTVADAAVDDVIEIKRKHRPQQGGAYWLGGSSGGEDLFFFRVKSGQGDTYIGDVFESADLLPADLVAEDVRGIIVDYRNGILNDGDIMTVTYKGLSDDITPLKEYNILGMMATDPGRVVITGGTKPDYTADLYDGETLLISGITAACPASILGTIPAGSEYEATYREGLAQDTIYDFNPQIFGAL